MPCQRSALPALLRLSRLATLTEVDEVALIRAISEARNVPARATVCTAKYGAISPLLVVSGIAAQTRSTPGGKCQILSLFLPGDLIEAPTAGLATRHDDIVALGKFAFCIAPSAEASPSLAAAYAAHRNLAREYLIDSVSRLGRMSARERLTDLLLEFRERLDLAGLVEENGFELPISQEHIADLLGLTAVHISRTFRGMRLDGDLTRLNRRMSLNDPIALASVVGRPLVLPWAVS